MRKHLRETKYKQTNFGKQKVRNSCNLEDVTISRQSNLPTDSDHNDTITHVKILICTILCRSLELTLS